MADLNSMNQTLKSACKTVRKKSHAHNNKYKKITSEEVDERNDELLLAVDELKDKYSENWSYVAMTSTHVCLMIYRPLQ